MQKMLGTSQEQTRLVFAALPQGPLGGLWPERPCSLGESVCVSFLWRYFSRLSPSHRLFCILNPNRPRCGMKECSQWKLAWRCAARSRPVLRPAGRGGGSGSEK